MKTLYLDCSMGAAGDMLAGALLELIPEPEVFLKELNALGLKGVSVGREKAVKCGITGTHFSVKVRGEEEESKDIHNHPHPHDPHHGNHSHDSHPHPHSHSHGSLHQIEHLVNDHFALPQRVKEHILTVYTLLARAESQVHGRGIEEVHFHEVGTMDALADITAVCMLMDKLSPGQVIASAVHVGSGQVRCAHGILPVPAPATALLLKDIPIYGGKIRGELCTPTGAALLKHFLTRFGDMPAMRIQSIGYGMGKKDFEAANCIRALWGDGDTHIDCDRENNAGKQDEVWELSCNVDDMTAEAIGFALERLLSAGALEVYTLAAGMKKSRPGTCLFLLCKQEKKEELIRSMFKYTTTLGIRVQKLQRYILERTVREEETLLGPVQIKEASGYGVVRKKYEYEQLAHLARENGLSLEEILKKLTVK